MYWLVFVQLRTPRFDRRPVRFGFVVNKCKLELFLVGYFGFVL